MFRSLKMTPLAVAVATASAALFALAAAPVAQAPAGPAFKRILLSDQF